MNQDNTNKTSTAATNVAPKLFSISFCNIREQSSNINPVHHHLQSINPYALFLTETKIKPLSPNDNTILSPHLKCPGYNLLSSFFPNGGVCAFIRSDVQTLHLKQFDLSNPGFQLFWLKISLPHTTKYICTLYRSPNSNNHELLFDHLSKSIETITLQSPRSEIIVLGNFNIHNYDWLSYSSNVTNPAGREAEAFAVVNDLTQVIAKPTRVPDRAGEKANTLDLVLTSNASIYSPPTVSSPLGNSDHCLITLRHDFLPHLDRPFAPQRVFHYSKADWDSLRTFYSSYPWSSDFSNDPSSFASFITDAILLGMDLFIPSSYKSGKKNSPKWFNSQCTMAVNNKNHYFKEWKRLQTQHSRTSFIKSRNTCSKTIKNAKSSFVQHISKKSLPARLALAPFGLWPKLSPKTFANHLSLH